MSENTTRRTLLGVAGIAAVGGLAGCVGRSVKASQEQSETDTDGSGPKQISYAENTSPFPREGKVYSGWIHIVADGESADLTFDARFCSKLGDVSPVLVSSGGDEYILRFEVDAEVSGKSVATPEEGDRNCSQVKRISGGTNVPSEWDVLRVQVDGTTVLKVERAGTFPAWRPLPDPIQFE